MPSTVVHAGFALLLAVGLLGRWYDRRALAVLLVIVIAPEADTLLGWVMAGAHRTVLHTMLTSVVAGGLLYWDTTRPESWIRQRWGEYGVRVAWVGLFVHTFAHLALDWSHLSGINFFWPLVDQFFQLDGEIALSTVDGFVQTFVDIRVNLDVGLLAVDVGQTGTTADTHVANPAQPTPEPTEQVDRRFPIAVQGWQLYLILTGCFAAVARRFQTT